MFNEESRQLLGLSEHENTVLFVLGDDAWNITALSKEAEIKRTSLYPILGRIHERGLVKKVRKGKRTLWKRISAPELQDKLFALAERHKGQDTVRKEEVGIIASQESEYHLYRGEEKLFQIYESFGMLAKNTRLYGIQPNISAYSVMKKFPYDRLVKINGNIKKNQIIVEALLQENFLEYYVAHLKKEGKSKEKIRELLSAYGGRLAITTYVPKDTLDFDSELFFYRDVVTFLDWQEMVAVVIKNKDIAGIMKDLFELMKLSGQRVDQNPKVNELVEKM